MLLHQKPELLDAGYAKLLKLCCHIGQIIITMVMTAMEEATHNLPYCCRSHGLQFNHRA